MGPGEIERSHRPVRLVRAGVAAAKQCQAHQGGGQLQSMSSTSTFSPERHAFTVAYIKAGQLEDGQIVEARLLQSLVAAEPPPGA